MSESIDWLLSRSHATPLLTAEQEIHLARQVKAWLPIKDNANPTAKQRAVMRRGKRAWDTFFLANIRLVVMIAKRYIKRAEPHMTMEDLVQEGMVGLERAISKYDSTRGYKFSTYAFSWIRQSISRAIENHGRMIRLPTHSQTLLRKAAAYCDEYQRHHGRQPRMSEIVEHLDCHFDTLKAAMAHTNHTISLDQKVRNYDGGNGEPSSYLDLIADSHYENDYLNDLSDVAALLPELIHQLEPDDRYILERRYMTERPETLRKIGEELGVSRERIRQREAIAIRRLRSQVGRCLEQRNTQVQQCAA